MAKKGNYRPWKKYFCDEGFFSKDTEESFYWAGFIAADGCVRIKKSKYSAIKQLEINLSVDDIEHLELFKKQIKSESIIREYTDKDGNKHAHIVISSSKIYDNLVKFGMHPRKTHTLEFPEWVENHPLCKHFLRGYFDGDGGFYINKESKCPQMTMTICGTIKFLAVYKKLIEYGARVNSTFEPDIHNGQGRLMYSGNIMCAELTKYLYNDAAVYLERKNDIAKKYDSWRKRKDYSKIFPTSNELEKLYTEIGSTGKIGKMLGVSQGSISNLMRKYNLTHLYIDAEDKWKKMRLEGKRRKSKIINSNE